MAPRRIVTGRHGFSDNIYAWEQASNGEVSLLVELMSRPGAEAELLQPGIEQMIIMGDSLHMCGRKFGLCYRSDLRRTVQASTLLGFGDAWIETSLLREQRLGVIEFMTPEGRRAYLESVPCHDPYTFAPADGESFADVRERVRPYLVNEIMCGVADEIFIMGHSGVNKMIDCLIKDWTPEEFVAHYVHGDNKIYPGMWIEYSRVNPETGEESPTFDWTRTCCPWMDPEPSAWQVIGRKSLGSTLWSLASLKRLFSATPAA